MRRLVTIPISQYCEKARWALERAGLEYREERHVQGLHRLVSRRAGGSGTVPVLVAAEGVFSESEDIVCYADSNLDEHERLMPADRAIREEVLALSRRLDARLGPDGRRLIYAHMLPRKEQLMRFNNQGVPPWEARALSTLWPLARRWARRELAIRPTTLSDDGPRVRAEFDMVAELLSDGRPFCAVSASAPPTSPSRRSPRP